MPRENRSLSKKIIKPGKNIAAAMVLGLKEKMLSSINQGVKEITLDFSGTENIDSSGLGILIASHNSLKMAGGGLKIKNASEKICKFMQTMGLDKYFDVVSTS